MMWHDGWGGAGWLMIGVIMLLFWAIIFAGAVWLFRTLSDSSRANRSASDHDRPPTAREILDQRYARGELTDEEYRQRRDLLSTK